MDLALVADNSKKRGRRVMPRFNSPEETLRYWIEVRGIPQVHIAQTLGCTKQRLCDMLQGRRRYSDELLDLLGWERITEFRRKSGRDGMPWVDWPAK